MLGAAGSLTIYRYFATLLTGPRWEPLSENVPRAVRHNGCFGGKTAGGAGSTPAPPSQLI
ncbi:MAG: hypothetical protein AVDCRST_MAG88-2391 [uncultured Thermomicrobiales bacterium]|uniref:Uncharacterized protein n=1 Tax=uncultured Thermomicrobiales bacterium TaxID=1645740 RepID=A0A6J4VA70_9BACT|nr:MAG: hypothetical protein AVDCRST_MAG88-2391 [uncultured Thermomicrobiales bacterium]